MRKRSSTCGAFGNNRRSRKCPRANAGAAADHHGQEPSPVPATAVTSAGSAAGQPVVREPAQRLSSAALRQTRYFVFDLETTGFRGNGGGEIVQVAVNVVEADGTLLEDSFNQLVRPRVPISRGDSWLVHHISDEMVADKAGFAEVGARLLEFLGRHSNGGSAIGVLVAYNGNAFDFPFLAHELSKHKLSLPPFIRYTLDVLPMCREYANNVAPASGLPIPADTKLATMYHYMVGSTLDRAHDALADTRALVELLRSKWLWPLRSRSLYLLDVNEKCSDAVAAEPAGHDTDEEMEEEDPTEAVGVEAVEIDEEADDQLDEEADDDVDDDMEQVAAPAPDGWLLNTPFAGVDADGAFETWLAAERGRRFGLQYHPESVNTPEKAFKVVYGEALNLIVHYTNQYGADQDGSVAWRPLDKKELLTWLGICSLAAVQRRSDPPSKWFSTDPALGFWGIRRSMSARRFMQILGALHVCDLEQQPSRDSESYTPLYKVQEYFDVLFEKAREVYVPGQQLSLDETLMRAFGRIGFKVRVVTKAARYGIKLYVVTCASGYVLDVLPYCGKYKSVSEELEVFKPTVQVVLHLCRHYENSHRTVYTDRFYTGVELALELRKRGLHLVGTVQASRVPKPVRLSKAAGKALGRGGSQHHLFRYQNAAAEQQEIGLVCWMDKKPVHVLTTHHDTTSMGTCMRRTVDGTQEFPRPTVVGHYNDYMGGVDIADQRRLHIETRIHGLHRWWIRLFFYGFDVALCNAFRLFKSSIPATHRDANMTYCEFRLHLCKQWLPHLQPLQAPPHASTSRRSSTDSDPPPQHLPVRIDGYLLRCIVCAKWCKKRPIHSQSGKCTRPHMVTTKCQACGVPVCAPRTGRHCFTMLHEDERIRALYLNDAEVRRTKTTIKSNKT
mmetsp:Transcript_14682/g.44088  ORF Transcript_14682/g.44088 Transcript_14682/m.44088 type:complete len:898 (+) Transcript_14682:187-2880(+)